MPHNAHIRKVKTSPQLHIEMGVTFMSGYIYSNGFFYIFHSMHNNSNSTICVHLLVKTVKIPIGNLLPVI